MAGGYIISSVGVATKYVIIGHGKGKCYIRNLQKEDGIYRKELTYIMAKITKMKDRVEAVLQRFPETRKDDKLLIFIIWQRDYYGMSVEWQPTVEIPLTIKLLKKLSSPETIRRARQLIQAEGKYLPPKEVQRKRINQEAAVRREVKKTSLF